MKGWGWFAAAALVAAGVAGCGGGATEGVVRVATEAQYPPFEFKDKQGNITGFDVELMRAIANAGGFQVRFTNQPWDGIIPGLKGGRYDAIISAMTITEKRKKQVRFSDPYYDAGQVIAVRTTTGDVTQPADLQGKIVAVQVNTTGHEEAKKIVGVGEIRTFKNVELAFKELEAGRADAVINDEPTTRIYLQKSDKLKIVGAVLTAEQYGIAVRADDAALAAKINAGLKQVRASGEYAKLKARWIEGAGRK